MEEADFFYCPVYVNLYVWPVYGWADGPWFNSVFGALFKWRRSTATRLRHHDKGQFWQQAASDALHIVLVIDRMLIGPDEVLDCRDNTPGCSGTAFLLQTSVLFRCCSISNIHSLQAAVVTY